MAALIASVRSYTPHRLSEYERPLSEVDFWLRLISHHSRFAAISGLTPVLSDGCDDAFQRGASLLRGTATPLPVAEMFWAAYCERSGRERRLVKLRSMLQINDLDGGKR